jgi:hypothetical protein
MQYSALEEVRDGMAAGRAYMEAIHPETEVSRRTEIDAQLRKYCGYDTLAMVRLVRFFADSPVQTGRKSRYPGQPPAD